MAIRQEAGHRLILDAAARWKSECLESSGSVFSSQNLWTRGNFETLHRAFFGNLIEDSERTFYEKLKEQLEQYPADIKCLAAEMIWFMMLFPAGVSGERKRSDIMEIWSWSGNQLPVDHPLLGEVLDIGVGRAGVAYHTLRWMEFGLFIELGLAFKGLQGTEQSELVLDPWRFANWVDTQTPSARRPFRHVILHLLFPEHFERIANARHKRAIVYSLGPEIGQRFTVNQTKLLSPLELDQTLFSIRNKLEADHHGVQIDFYEEPISGTFSLTFPPPQGPKWGKYPAPPAEIDPSDPESAKAVANILTNDPKTLRSVLDVFAEAIRIANSESASRWALTLSKHRMSLNVGRMQVLGIRRGRLTMAAETELAGAFDADAPEILAKLKSAPFSSVSGMDYYTVPEPDIENTLPVLAAGLRAAIEAASKTWRRPIGLKNHSPGAIDFLEKALGVELPRPTHESGAADGIPEAVEVTTPLSGFRATELDLDALISDVENGDIGLPDIQRPFVWSATKVRDLFDSMYRGYPVGYLLFWETNAAQQNSRNIGLNPKSFGPKRLIVDGQQRLTSLYAVMRGQPILNSDYQETRIDIAFRPRDGRFEVTDAAIRRDPEYISSISDWLSDKRSSYALISEFLQALMARRELSSHDRAVIESNLERLFQLKRYRFSVLQISADLEEEAVADIFVRINSQGVKLNQADFILTLLSVIWEEGRIQLEEFSRNCKRPAGPKSQPTPFNHLIMPSPDQMLRVSVAKAFGRARLRSVYHLLRGKDPDTGALVLERRAEQLELMKAAQAEVLDLNNWHRFISCLTGCGFRVSDQIPSQNALLLAYAIYLHGLRLPDFGAVELDRIVGQWFWMAVLTSRFSGAVETAMEQDLARIGPTKSRAAFLEVLDKVIATELTNDYWTLTLPVELETSSTRSAGWSTFVASQLQLEAPVLFSDKKLWSILDPLTRGTRKGLEAHHLFPKAWLAARGITDRKEVNQIANLALLEWPANMKAGARKPAEYVAELREHLDDASWQRMCRLHALPPEWYEMDYPAFLHARRDLMAQLIRRGFGSLTGDTVEREAGIADGSAAEQAVWTAISNLERELRSAIRSKFLERWGSNADGRIERILGETSVATIHRNRDKYLKQYKYSDAPHGDDIFDFLYLGQLIQLMKSNETWDLFKTPFRDKRQLEDLAAAIIPVRNDAAHFRTVPSNELDRCRVAVHDLRKILRVTAG